MAIASESVYKEIKGVLGLPDNAISCTIKLDVGEPALVEVTTFAEINQSEHTTKKFKLVEIEDDTAE